MSEPIRALIDVVGGRRDENGFLYSRIPAWRFGKTETGRTRNSAIGAIRLRKSVLLAIAASADPDGTHAWISYETIAERCVCSVSQAKRTVRWLVEAGLLICHPHAHRVPGTRITLNEYIVHFPDLEEGVNKSDEVSSGRHFVEPDEVSSGRHFVDATKCQIENDEVSTKADEVSTKGGRSVTLMTPYRPIDRPTIPPSLKPERNREDNNNNNNRASGKWTDASAAAAARRTLSENPEGKRKINERELMAELSNPAFIGKFEFRTTAAHRKEAVEVASQYGPQTFLAAFRFWWETGAPNDMSLGKDAHGKPQYKTWLLHAFLRSGAGLRALEAAIRYGEHDPTVVATLLEKGIPPEILSEAHYAALTWLSQNEILEGLPWDSKSISESLMRAEETCRAWSADKPWEEYRPLVQKLLELQPAGALQ